MIYVVLLYFWQQQQQQRGGEDDDGRQICVDTAEDIAAKDMRAPKMPKSEAVETVKKMTAHNLECVIADDTCRMSGLFWNPLEVSCVAWRELLLKLSTVSAIEAAKEDKSGEASWYASEEVVDVESGSDRSGGKRKSCTPITMTKDSPATKGKNRAKEAPPPPVSNAGDDDDDDDNEGGGCASGGMVDNIGEYQLDSSSSDDDDDDDESYKSDD